MFTSKPPVQHSPLGFKEYISIDDDKLLHNISSLPSSLKLKIFKQFLKSSDFPTIVNFLPISILRFDKSILNLCNPGYHSKDFCLNFESSSLKTWQFINNNYNPETELQLFKAYGISVNLGTNEDHYRTLKKLENITPFVKSYQNSVFSGPILGPRFGEPDDDTKLHKKLVTTVNYSTPSLKNLTLFKHLSSATLHHYHKNIDVNGLLELLKKHSLDKFSWTQSQAQGFLSNSDGVHNPDLQNAFYELAIIDFESRIKSLTITPIFQKLEKLSDRIELSDKFFCKFKNLTRLKLLHVLYIPTIPKTVKHLEIQAITKHNGVTSINKQFFEIHHDLISLKVSCHKNRDRQFLRRPFKTTNCNWRYENCEIKFYKTKLIKVTETLDLQATRIVNSRGADLSEDELAKFYGLPREVMIYDDNTLCGSLVKKMLKRQKITNKSYKIYINRCKFLDNFNNWLNPRFLETVRPEVIPDTGRYLTVFHCEKLIIPKRAKDLDNISLREYTIGSSRVMR